MLETANLNVKRPFTERGKRLSLTLVRIGSYLDIIHSGRSPNSVPIRKQAKGIFEKGKENSYIHRRKVFLLVQVT